MAIQLLGLDEIAGSIVVLDQVPFLSYEEMVKIKQTNGRIRTGRVVEIHGQKAVIQVFEGTHDLGLADTITEFQGHPMQITPCERGAGSCV